MTNTIKTQSELNEMKVADIREYAKENFSPITGAWKMKKQDLIEALLKRQEEPTLIELDDEEIDELEVEIVPIAEVTDETFKKAGIERPKKAIVFAEDILVEIDVEPTKSVKKQSQDEIDEMIAREKLTYLLLDEEGQEVCASTVKLDVVKFAIANNICNAGWINRSIKTGEKVYIDGKTGKNTRPKNSKYTGVGYSVVVR